MYIYIGHIYTFICVKWIIYTNRFRCYETSKNTDTISNEKASHPPKKK